MHTYLFLSLLVIIKQCWDLSLKNIFNQLKTQDFSLKKILKQLKTHRYGLVQHSDLIETYLETNQTKTELIK